MGEHIDNRKYGKKKRMDESDPLNRKRRATFKTWLHEQEEELLEDDFDLEEDAKEE